MTNLAAARELVARVRALGVDDFCVCAGSRNAPLLAALADARVHSFVDERSAAFFALGRSKRDGKPVAVVTTSGTAVAELLPAAVEAHYSGTPLVLVTADRPARFRGTGSPQSIEQVGIFGAYAATDAEKWDRRSPLHLNIEFDEPLIDDVIPSVVEGPGWVVAPEPYRPSPQVPRYARDDRQPLVLAGGLAPRHRDRVRDFALRLGAPVYAEPLSGLREDAALAALHVLNERSLGRGSFDRVIRIGNVPTLRFWRDLEMTGVPVEHYSDLPFTGITRGEVRPIEALPEPEPVALDEAFLARDQEQAALFRAILDSEPDSELAMLRVLSLKLARGTRIYLGNSLPIREWDLVATREPRGFVIEANRGANGIDGQLSTFFGWCAPGADNVAIVGDLTALYDLNAPWIVPQLEADFRIVIINNGGGRIFSRVASLRPLDRQFREKVIENAHPLRFEHWAKMFGIEDRVIELHPDPEASRRAWERYDALWA